MARINTYQKDEQISLGDKLLGTDKDNSLKPTRNYTIKDLRDFFLDGLDGNSQDNIPVSITLPQILEPSQNTNVLQDASSLINSLEPFIISSVQIPFFSLRRGSRVYVLVFQGLGKGVYGELNKKVAPSQLQIISEKFINLENISNSSTTTTINLFNIGDSLIENVVNSLVPPIEIKPIAQGFTVFIATQDGEPKSWLYNGSSGVFGENEGQTVANDFNEISVSSQTEGEAFLEEDVVTNVKVGASEANSVITEGTSFTDYVKLVHQDVFNPTFQNPTFSLGRSGGGLRIIGATENITLTYNFNRGSILGDFNNSIWNPNAFQNPRAGVATLYVINGQNNGTNNILSLTDYEIQLGVNTFSGSVTFEQGEQPLNSLGNAFESPLSGGTETRSTSFEGVYPLFGTTSNIQTLTQRALVSMISANNVTFNLVGETATEKQKIEIPNAWLSSRALQSIQYFNTLVGDWDSTNRINEFDTSSVNKTIEGNSVAYTRYTHNGSRRDGIAIRLIF